MNDKEHKKIVDIFNKADLSPAGLSYKMIHESRYVNESVIQYMVNYIIMWGTRKPENVPPYMENVHAWCSEMYQMLDKMGLTHANSRAGVN